MTGISFSAKKNCEKTKEADRREILSNENYKKYNQVFFFLYTN